MTPEAAKYLKIPQELLRDRRLTFGEMCHLCLIAQLQNAKGCTATNQYFGDYFDIKRNNSARTISALKRKGFIHAVEVKSGGKTIERTITIIEPDSIKLLLTESNKGIKKIPSNGIKSCNGLVSERDTIHKKRHKSTHKNIFDATSASMEISRLLFSFIQQRDSKVKEPDFQKWAVHIDGLPGWMTEPLNRLKRLFGGVRPTHFGEQIFCQLKNSENNSQCYTRK